MASKLTDVLTNAAHRDAVISDCVALIEAEVEDKRGLKGMAVRTAYKAVRSIRPSFIMEACGHLLPAFAEALNPIYAQAQASGDSVAHYIGARGAEVADALLRITDDRAGGAKHGLVKATYQRLRPTAKKHVEAAVPRIGALIAKHTA